MAKKAIRKCSKMGCMKLTRSRFCEKHTKEFDEKQKTTKHDRDLHRGSSSERGYDKTWQRFRKFYLRRHPICEKCEDYKDLHVHHIKPINEGGARLDPDNLMTLCRSCHEKVHGRKRQ